MIKIDVWLTIGLRIRPALLILKNLSHFLVDDRDMLRAVGRKLVKPALKTHEN